MCRRMLLSNVVLVMLSAFPLLGQKKPESAAAVGVQEFPLVLEKGVTAGKTPVGTKVQGKLSVATLVNGKVVPRNAVFSGEVVESLAKTKTEPSRISIRMDSIGWKQGSQAVTVYLTSWYYPTLYDSGQDLRYGPDQPANRTWDGQGQYPDQNSRVYRPFPGSEDDKKSSVPNAANPVSSNRPISMKDVETEHGSDGAIVLVSKRENLKLSNFTTYVFAASDVPASK